VNWDVKGDWQFKQSDGRTVLQGKFVTRFLQRSESVRHGIERKQVRTKGRNIWRYGRCEFAGRSELKERECAAPGCHFRSSLAFGDSASDQAAPSESDQCPESLRSAMRRDKEGWAPYHDGPDKSTDSDGSGTHGSQLVRVEQQSAIPSCLPTYQ
jgi:hypothetical protein